MSNPFLDVSDILLDPDIAGTFDVCRRVQVIGINGRAKARDSWFRNVLGVVCIASPGDLERLDDNQRMGRNISIVTRFRLNGPAVNGRVDYQPDYILWMGDHFIVKHLDPYPQYGNGFIQAIAGSVDSIDQVVPT